MGVSTRSIDTRATGTPLKMTVFEGGVACCVTPESYGPTLSSRGGSVRPTQRCERGERVRLGGDLMPLIGQLHPA